MKPINHGSALLLALLSTILCIGCHRTRPIVGFGDEWRSLTVRERQIFVSAYIDGSSQSATSLCNDLESHLVSLKFQKDMPESNQPCLQFMHRYTHGDASKSPTLDYANPYVRVIDDFYKHPECRIMPYYVLLEHLNDAEYKSGEDLYKFVRSGKASWGFFSGFDGIEDCYGVDRKR